MGYNPSVLQKTKYEFSPLGKTLSGKVKKTDKIVKKDKQNNKTT